MSKNISIHWFRQDLRTNDNPALLHAAKHGEVIPVYILDDKNAGAHKMGAASRVWLHHSLSSLDKKLKNTLSCYIGDPATILMQLCSDHGASKVTWNRCYEPWQIKVDDETQKQLESADIEVSTHNGALLWEPDEALKADGTPYRVFTAFYRNGCMSAGPPRKPLGAPTKAIYTKGKESQSIKSLNLIPNIPWDKPMMQAWTVGEAGAKKSLTAFMEAGLNGYKEMRNFPAKKGISRLSPHLHFGEISPHQVWHAINDSKDDEHSDCFCSELGWREFSNSLLYFNPELPKKNLQAKFDRFPWKTNKAHLKAWQKGLTGVPIVDAGMRELWQTGFMHNRVRMIVGSFLVKNLLLHWHHGERWFWDCLVDADLANNSASWQWIAGCGADAAPYFRIFNPVTQAKRFDADGKYITHYLPELKKLPLRYLFSPWEAPQNVMDAAGITLGKEYPKPIVDLSESRKRALDAFASIK